MTWVDWAILIVIASCVAGGLMQGFFRTACSLLGLVLGLSLGAWNYRRGAAYLLPVLRIRGLADAIAFCLIALTVVVVANVVGTILARVFQWMGLGCLDTLGGGALGFFQGVVLVTLVVLVTVAFFPGAQWLTRSRLPRNFFGAVNVTAGVTPVQLAARLHQGLRLLEQESPSWMHPQQGPS